MCVRPARKRSRFWSAPSGRRRKNNIPRQRSLCGRQSSSGRAARQSSAFSCTTEEVDEILALLAQLEAFIKLEDLDDYLAACGELTARLEHVRRMELPTVENVM